MDNPQRCYIVLVIFDRHCVLDSCRSIPITGLDVRFGQIFPSEHSQRKTHAHENKRQSCHKDANRNACSSLIQA